MTDYSNRSLGELRRSYLRESSDAMPMAGFICWATLAALAWYLGEALPYWAVLALGVGLLSGAIWVPHGWSADDPAGLIQFLLRAVLCFAAYFLAPAELAVPAIAAAVAASYIHAIVLMKKPKNAVGAGQR